MPHSSTDLDAAASALLAMAGTSASSNDNLVWAIPVSSLEFFGEAGADVMADASVYGRIHLTLRDDDGSVFSILTAADAKLLRDWLTGAIDAIEAGNQPPAK